MTNEEKYDALAALAPARVRITFRNDHQETGALEARRIPGRDEVDVLFGGYGGLWLEGMSAVAVMAPNGRYAESLSLA